MASSLRSSRNAAVVHSMAYAGTSAQAELGQHLGVGDPRLVSVTAA
ncbi:hypothetical protein [Candidatus Frankia alpina]|nr:hypothetical protein [Candidatus Frankia alpina]